MNTLNVPLAWMFVALTALFSLGLSPRWSGRFYPTSPNLPRRLAAPAIFALLTAACFTGFALQSLTIVVIAGVTLIAVHRRTMRSNPGPHVQ